MRFTGIILLALVLFASCRSTRPIQTAISAIDTAAVTPGSIVAAEDSADFIRQTYEEILKNRIDYRFFSAKLDVEYEDAEGKNYDVNVHLRMLKHSVIWITITGPLGIEGHRAMITRDSVKMMDKQNKTYSAHSVSFLQELTALPLTLGTLQDLVIGNPVYFDSTITSYSRNDQGISLQVFNHFFRHLLTISNGEKLLKSSKLDDQDRSRNRTCHLTYEDYENRKGVNFSRRRRIHVSEKKKLEVELDFKQYDFNETLSFPFNIPKNYDRS